jgi:hypothetical protein
MPTWVALALGLAGLVWVCAARAASVPPARTARMLNVTDEARLHLTNTEGEVIEEGGPVRGALPGTLRVRLAIGANVTGSFTFYARGGSISGHGSARLNTTGTYASFGGTLTVSHGTGRYAHAHGHGGLYGAVNRRTYALIVQTTGRLSY